MKARDNPFRSERVDALTYRAPGFSWEWLEESLLRCGGRGALEGPEGTGKTTLLLAWAARRRSRGDAVAVVKVAEGQRRLTAGQLATLAGADGVFLDGSEQLGWFGWREARRRIARSSVFVATSHPPARLPVLHVCRTHPGLVADLVGELGARADDVGGLWTRHGGNIRAVFRELYDRHAAAAG